MIDASSPNFSAAIMKLRWKFKRNAKEVRQLNWQGVDVSKRPEMVAYELMNTVLEVPLNGEDLAHYRSDICPNLPWCDDHFLERVCGEPINPGVEWANWPWGKSASGFLDQTGKFNHNYMERYWPKYAGHVDGPTRTAIDYDEAMHQQDLVRPHEGIYGKYGDLGDIVNLLVKDPLTRQAYLPIYFPEDTGTPGRKPCTLGYQFLMRDNRLHVWYPLRSCDFIRHFRDDIYLTVRLLLWVLDECRKLDPEWNNVTPGTYAMHCTSLHVFKADWQSIVGE